MKKKWYARTFLALALALVLVLAIGAMSSGAWFKDTSNSSSNIITAGRLDLTVDGVNETAVAAKITADKLQPGAWDNVGHVQLKNVGNVPGKLSIRIKNVTNAENGITQPESAAGDTSANAGELGGKIGISVQENVSPWTRYDVMNGLTDGVVLSTQGRILQPGETIELVFYATWPQGDSDNMAQGDSVGFDLEFVLDQVH